MEKVQNPNNPDCKEQSISVEFQLRGSTVAEFIKMIRFCANFGSSI
jgi:hypothetical protein